MHCSQALVVSGYGPQLVHALLHRERLRCLASLPFLSVCYRVISARPAASVVPRKAGRGGRVGKAGHPAVAPASSPGQCLTWSCVQAEQF